jgi:integrase
VGEACALDVWHVDRRRRRLHVVTSKNGEDRWVPIAASVLGMLDLSRGRTDPLLTNSRGGRVDKDNWRARVFRPAVEEAGLGAVRIHDLRHTAASLAIASGADVKAVQRMLGHRSAKMTLDLYGHLWDAALDDVAARMDGVIRAETG